jgi:hypothetical protein
MAYRLEIDVAFNVRARKGERRERGTGRLIKCLIYRGTRDECFADARSTDAAMTGGHSEVIAVRGYDEAAYKIDPLKAIPEFVAATL